MGFLHIHNHVIINKRKAFNKPQEDQSKMCQKFQIPIFLFGDPENVSQYD